MPAAVPLVAGIAGAAIGGTAVAFSIGAFAVTYGAIYGGIASLGASLLMGAAMKPKGADLSGALNQPGGGRTLQVREPVAPLQIPYGMNKASGPMLFIHSQEDVHERTYGWLFVVHGLAGTKIKAIRDVYHGTSLTTDPKYDPNGGLIRVGKHLGDPDQEADADFVAQVTEGKWGPNHRLRGRAYIATRLEWDFEILPQLENISAVLDGVDSIFDPRTHVIRFSNNWALCVANWLTSDFGMGLAWEDLDEPSLIAAANVSDERVLVVPGVAECTIDIDTGQITLATGSRVLNWGDGVRVFSDTFGTLPAGFAVDTTYYVIPSTDETIQLAASVEDAFNEVPIIPTDAGTGTLGLTYYDEARYKLDGIFTLDVEKGEVLQQMLTAGAGVVVYIGGKWFIHAGTAALPTVTLDDNDLRGSIEVVPKRSMRDRFNGVRAVYVSPTSSWQPTDAPPLIDEDYKAEDAGEELIQDIRLPFTISTPAAQRLMRIELERNRRQMVVKYPANYSAMRLQAWDGVYITSSEYGWEQKQFRVIGWALAEGGGIDLTLQEDDADVYAWSVEDELVSAEGASIILPDPSNVQAVPSLTVITPEITFTRLGVEWEAAGNLDQEYELEFRTRDFATWTSFGKVGLAQARKATVEKSVATDFRIRAIVDRTRASAWTNNLAPGDPTDFTSPGAGELSWTNGSGAAYVSLWKDGVFFELVDVTDATHTRTGLGDGTYRIRSRNAFGNVSNPSNEVVISGVGAGDDAGDGDDDGGGDGGGDV